jgi:hypothetical protein
MAKRQAFVIGVIIADERKVAERIVKDSGLKAGMISTP